MKTGRGGMGSHKHGTSGHAPHSPAFKHQRTREANALADAERAKRPRPKTYSSLTACLNNEKTPRR